MNDHELTVLVEAAASGAVNSQAVHHGGDVWDELHASIKNGIRENALPFIYHGAKALEGLGYSKPRTITTWEEVDALADGAVIRDSAGTIRERFNDVETAVALWYRTGSGGHVLSGQFKLGKLLPATVLYEPTP